VIHRRSQLDYTIDSPQVVKAIDSHY